MIKTKTATNFLRHIFANSMTDIANITVAEAEDDYNTILHYLASIQHSLAGWIEELKKEREEKK